MESVGRSKGFGFVTMENKEDANLAIKEITGLDIDGRTVRVEISTNDGSRRAGGGRGGGDRGRDDRRRPYENDRRDNRDNYRGGDGGFRRDYDRNDR